MTGSPVDLAGRHAVVTGAAMIARVILPVDGGNLARNAGETIGE